ncbi:MAG TPA: hypothetical protein VF688_00725 [Allosphingosinicella sp.]
MCTDLRQQLGRGKRQGSKAGSGQEKHFTPIEVHSGLLHLRSRYSSIQPELAADSAAAWPMCTNAPILRVIAVTVPYVPSGKHGWVHPSILPA